MFEANKNAWVEKIFAVYNRNLFKRRFHSLKASGLDYLRARKKQTPLIIYANHSSWWDGLVAFEISRFAGLDAFVMMEEKQLRKLSLFRRLGAFSVIRENPREAVKSINYAVSLLAENPNRSLWVFPQGEILPNGLRPLKFFNGVSRTLEKLENGCASPLAIRYDFLSEFKPEIFVKVGEPEIVTPERNFNSKTLTKCFEMNLTRALDELENDVLNKKFGNYSVIF